MIQERVCDNCHKVMVFESLLLGFESFRYGILELGIDREWRLETRDWRLVTKAGEQGCWRAWERGISVGCGKN